MMTITESGFPGVTSTNAMACLWNVARRTLPWYSSPVSWVKVSSLQGHARTEAHAAQAPWHRVDARPSGEHGNEVQRQVRATGWNRVNEDMGYARCVQSQGYIPHSRSWSHTELDARTLTVWCYR